MALRLGFALPPPPAAVPDGIIIVPRGPITAVVAEAEPLEKAAGPDTMPLTLLPATSMGEMVEGEAGPPYEEPATTVELIVG